MDSTEGRVSEIAPANNRGIVQGTLENPMSKPMSADSFGITVDIRAQEAIGAFEKPWALVRITRSRGMAANTNPNDPRNVILQVGNAEQLHKFVLNKSLLIFSSMWFCKILEESLVPNGICTIEDVTAQHFECIVHYLLGHFTWEFTTMEDACEQIETANRCELKGFNDELFERLTRLITTKQANFNNAVVCRAWGLFVKLDSNDVLENLARWYILKNAATILRGDNFLKLSSEYLLEFLTADDLAVDSELDVYKALIRWGVYNLKEMSKQITAVNMRNVLLSLFPAVRFYNMSRSEIRNYVLPMQLLLPEHTQCLENWCSRITGNPEDYMVYSNVRRNYDGKVDVARDNETDEQSKLDRAEAETFLARYDSERCTYNFNLEILKLRYEMAREISNVKSLIGNTNGDLNQTVDELNQTKQKLNQAIEGQNYANEELKQTKEKLNQAIEELIHSKEELDQTKAKQYQGMQEQNKTNEELSRTKIALNQRTKNLNQKIKANKTSVQLTDPYKYFYLSFTDYCRMPSKIPPNTTRSFGFDREECVSGLISYCIHDKRFLVNYWISSGLNDFVLGFAPANIPLNTDPFKDIDGGDWSKFTDRRKAKKWVSQSQISKTKDLTKDLNLTLEFGNLKAEASMITGEKALLSIVLSEK